MEDSPKKMYRISQTQLSIARHYGGCIFNGKNYIYDPTDDSLTREDVWKAEKKAKKKATVKESLNVQGEIFR